MAFGKAIPRELLVRRHLIPALLGVILVAAMAWAGIYRINDVSLLRTLEYASYDIRLRASLSHQTDDRIVIVDIDEKSLAAEGRWPWSRHKIAALVDNLAAADVAVVAFDVVFAEPEERSDRRILTELLSGPLGANSEFAAIANQKIIESDGDARFSRSLGQLPAVMGFFFDAATDAESTGALPENGADASSYLQSGIQFGVVADSYGANLEQFQQAAASGGFFNTRLDPDGVLRRVPLFTQYGSDIYPLLSLEAVRLYLNEPGWKLATDTLMGSKAIDFVMLGEHRINSDSHAQMLIPYRGGAGSYTYISATDVLNGRAPSESLNGKIVFVGTSAKGLLDLRPTPITPIYPGVEVHATVADAILNGGIRAETLEKDGIDLVLLVGIGLVLSLLLTVLQPMWGIIAAVTSAALVIAVNLFAWSGGVVLALATPLLTIALLLGANLAYGFLFKSRDRRQMQSMFGQYVPPDEKSQNPDSFNLNGESRLMTVLFADIRSFTSISDRNS